MKASRPLIAALIGAAAVLAIACHDQSPLATAPPPAPPRALLGDALQSVSLLTCTPMAADSAARTIGPEGGVIAAGPDTLTIPAGALADTVTITAVAPSDTVNRVVFGPQGLTFLQPASLTMGYANCGVLGTGLQIAYTNDELEILELLPSILDLTTQTVTAQIGHFSDYAIAW